MKARDTFKNEFVVEARFHIGQRCEPGDLAAAIMRAVNTKAFRLMGVCKIESVKRVNGGPSATAPKLIGPEG